MAQSPERSFPEKVLRAHTLAGKAHKDGAKPLTRLGGAVVVGAIGVAGEKLIETVRPKALKKLFDIDTLPFPKFLQELFDDGLVGVVYTIANTHLGKAFPELKLRHFATSTIGTAAGMGIEKLNVPEKLKSMVNYVNPVTALAADEARMAFVDWLEAYKAVSAGTEDEFVKTYKPKDEKEPSITKETTIIYLGLDQSPSFAVG